MNELHQDQPVSDLPENVLAVCTRNSLQRSLSCTPPVRAFTPHMQKQEVPAGNDGTSEDTKVQALERLLSSLNLTPGAFVKKQHVTCFQLFFILACEDTRSQWLSTESPGWLVKTKTGRTGSQGLGPENLSFK